MPNLFLEFGNMSALGFFQAYLNGDDTSSLFFGEPISICCSRSLLFPLSFPFYSQFCCPLYRLSFLLDCGCWLSFQEREILYLRRVVTLSGLVRICKMVPVEGSILAELIVYQLDSLS